MILISSQYVISIKTRRARIWFILADHKIYELHEQETNYLNTIGKDKLKYIHLLSLICKSNVQEFN
jgi:hypothetical protein